MWENFIETYVFQHFFFFNFHNMTLIFCSELFYHNHLIRGEKRWTYTSIISPVFFFVPIKSVINKYILYLKSNTCLYYTHFYNKVLLFSNRHPPKLHAMWTYRSPLYDCHPPLYMTSLFLVPSATVQWEFHRIWCV